jgi:hypothetical protein
MRAASLEGGSGEAAVSMRLRAVWTLLVTKSASLKLRRQRAGSKAGTKPLFPDGGEGRSIGYK